MLRFHVDTLLPTLLCAVAVAAVGPAGATPVTEYLYIEANEGGSSGGHAAVRLGDIVYHFQHHAPGVIRLHRDSTEHFLSYYTGLQNRTIHASRIVMSDETYTLLSDYFSGTYLVQQKQFDILAAREDDVRLLEMLRDAQRGMVHRPDPVRLRGAGYFYTTVPPLVVGTSSRDQISLEQEIPPSPPSPKRWNRRESEGGIERLRARVLDTYGPDAIRRRAAQLYTELLALDPASSDADVVRLAEDAYPHTAPTFSERHRDLMLGLVALQVLETGPPLQPGTYRAPDADAFRLSADEARALQAFSADVERDLTPLIRSPRPDWGFALLIGMARLRALDETERRGSFVFLDSFPPESEVISRKEVDRNAQALPALLAATRAEMHTARAALLGEPAVREATFTDLEAAGNRLLELSNAAGGGSDLRVHAGRLIPSKEAPIADLIAPQLGGAQLDSAIVDATRRRDDYQAQLTQFYGYHLLTKNCVSEIFRYVNAALDPAGSSALEISTTRLGGYIEPGGSLSFIPFVSADAVRRNYHVTQTSTLPSYRTKTVDGMYAREDHLLVFLRESNAVTSTVYRRNPRDSYFIFFTDDTVATRPVFGAINLLAGVGAGVAGLALLPFDGGHTLQRGLKGALFSLPELAFFNVRKGTFEYVADDSPMSTDAS